MAANDHDRNLLFGILAVQMDFISRDALVAAMNAWILAKHKPLGEVLVEQRALAGDRRTLLDALVCEHLKQHGDDPRQSLAAVTSLGSVEEDLQQLGDGDVNASLRAVASARPARSLGERTTTVGIVTSAGTRFRILRPHAEGGLGKVSVARDEELGREVALKEIKPRHADNLDSRARFLLEAEITGGLEHPGIVPVYGLGQYADGRPYYAMRFIRGDSLQEAVDRYHDPAADKSNAGERAVELRKLLGRFLDVCNAIAYAHSRGVLHRDLKPGNIMLGQYGETLVVDWGLAKTVDRPDLTSASSEGQLRPHSASGSAATQMGAALGTPQYMSPEQAAGRLDLLGPASDVYSLGATLFYVLTGKPPIEADDIGAVLHKVEHGEFRPPRAVNPEIARALNAICLKAMALKPADRYASPRALADDIEHWLADEAVTAHRDSLPARFSRATRRHKVATATVAALLLAAVAGLSIGTLLLGREQARTNAAKQDALARLWDSYLVSARAMRMSNQPGQRFASLRAIQSALALETPKDRSQDELRTEAIAALVLPDFEEAQRCSGCPQDTADIAIDPAFQRYALGGIDGRVSIRQVADDRELFQLPGIGRVQAYGGLQFGADGRYFLQSCETAHGLMRRIWRLRSTPELVLSSRGACAFSPDGRQLALVAAGSLRLNDLDSGKELRRFSLAGPPLDWLLWNPRRPILLARSADRRSYRLLDLATGNVGPIITPPFVISWISWQPEGRLLAIAEQSRHPKLHLVRADNGEPEMPPLEAHLAGGALVCFNHCGDRLLSTDWSDTWRLWDVRTGQLLLTQRAGGNVLHFSDDDRLAGLDVSPQAMRMFRFARGREICKIAHRVHALAGSFYSFGSGSCPLDGEGRLLAYPVPEGIAVADVVRGEEVALLPLGKIFPVGVDESASLLTHSSAGLQQWPMTRDGATGQRVYGPPKTLAAAMGAGPSGGTSDKNCKVFAFPNRSGASELTLPQGNQRRLGPQEDVRHCAVSPDGRWIATGSHTTFKDAGAKLWEAKTGSHAADLPVLEMCNVAFSPDGRWLLTTGGGARLWSVGDWKEGPDLGPSAKIGVFSAGGDLLALRDASGVVRLVFPDSGRDVARLTAPGAQQVTPLYFTRDRSRLVCFAEDETLCIFNLGLIRSELAAMGLDWEGPPCPAESDCLPEPLTVKFVGAK